MKLFFFFCFIFSLQLFSQQENKNSAIEISSYFGNGIGLGKGKIENKFKAYSISYSKKLNENLHWVKFLNAKEIKYKIIYFNLNGMRGIFEDDNYKYGSVFGLIVNVDFKITEFSKFEIFLSPGIGLVYVNNTYKTKPTSFLFGTHINAAFDAKLLAEYHFSKDFSLILSTGFTHYSNGAISLPNAGLNLVQTGIGLKKYFKTEENFTISTSKFDDAFEINLAAGQRGKYKENSAFYRLAAYTGYNKTLNNVLGLKGGIDAVYYDKTYNPETYIDFVPYKANSYDHIRLGISLGAEIKMNQISVNYQFGKYIYFKNPTNQKYYWKAGIRYYLDENIGLEATLYSHKVQADFIGFGAFFRIK